MAFEGMKVFFDGVNEALAEEQQYGDGGYGGYISRVHINSILGTTLGMVPSLLGK